MEKVKKVRKVSILEIIVYAVGGALALWGLTYMVLGLFGEFLPSGNGVKDASDVIKKTFGLSFFWWGVIILLIGMVIVVFTLCLNAKKSDREIERETRRAARLAQFRKSEEDPKGEIIDAEVGPAQGSSSTESESPAEEKPADADKE